MVWKRRCSSRKALFEEMKEESELDKGGLGENVPDGNKGQRGRNSRWKELDVITETVKLKD